MAQSLSIKRGRRKQHVKNKLKRIPDEPNLIGPERRGGNPGGSASGPRSSRARDATGPRGAAPLPLLAEFRGVVRSDDLLRPGSADTCHGSSENLGGFRRLAAARRVERCPESGKPDRQEPTPSVPGPLSGARPSLPAGCHVGCPEVGPAAVRPRLCPRAARLPRGLSGHAGHPARLGLCHLPGRLGERLGGPGLESPD